jgi:hypothetical protein
MKKIVISMCLMLCGLSVAQADGKAIYRVTITNGTLHQVITPPIVITHRNHYQLFKIGQAASDSLATLAETGNNLPLLGDVQAAHGVFDAVAGSGPVLYGQSASFDIRAPRHGRISLAAMLATTNDGFVALNGVPLPRHSARYLASVYDAGSENNNESCAYVPGPPCAPDSGNLSDDGEGYVSFHSGIYGGSDLNPKHLDWRGPVAVVTITRIEH